MSRQELRELVDKAKRSVAAAERLLRDGDDCYDQIPKTREPLALL